MPEEQSDYDRAVEEMREFEERDELPSDLSEWPSGKAKYITIGQDSDAGYGEDVTSKLGPAEVEHHGDGTVTVAGEQADASEYKSEPISSGMVEQIEQSKERYREILREHPDLQEDGERPSGGPGDPEDVRADDLR